MTVSSGKEGTVSGGEINAEPKERESANVSVRKPNIRRFIEVIFLQK
jgi:hypothetical protein